MPGWAHNACAVLIAVVVSSATLRAQSSMGDAARILEGLAATQETSADDGDVRVSQHGVIEMHVKDADLYTVLKNLLLQTRTNMVISPKVQGRVSVSLYNVTLEEALHSILRQNGAGFRREGNFIYIHTLEDLQDLERITVPLEARSYWLNYISPEQARMLLLPFLSEEGEITLGPAADTGLAVGTSGQAWAIEDVIVVKDHAENLERINAQLAMIDRRPRQVLLEATIVAADLSESNAMGIDFNVLGGVDFELLAGSTNLINGANGGGGGGAGTGGGGTTAGGGSGSDFGRLARGVPTGHLDDTTYSMSTNFAAAVPEGGISIGFVTDEVSAFLRALESVTNTTVLANPKVLALNKQVGRLLIGSRNGYRTLTTTETTTSENVEFLESGIELTFRPFISNDGYVRLEVSPSDSDGSVNAQGLPSERTTEVTTNIQIKDGHTVFIGGLFREFDTTGRSQIPGVGNIPLVGALLGSTSDATLRQEIIILLTVHIINDDEPYAEYSEAMLDDIERLRVGVRENMQWHGRSRLAQAHFERALDHVRAAERDRALWHLSLAIHNRPGFLEALKVREELLQERAWDADGSMMRTFLHELLIREQGLPYRAPFGRPDSVSVFPDRAAPRLAGFEPPALADRCPDDPAKTLPGVCGCNASEGDSDGDGSPDCIDACPYDADVQDMREDGCCAPDPGSAAARGEADPDRPDTDAEPAEDPALSEPRRLADRDHDGTADEADGCPDDPAKLAPGTCGCGIEETDRDGDGVGECAEEVFGARDDRCPDDPHKQVPGRCGCGTADVDGDGDGVIDCLED